MIARSFSTEKCFPLRIAVAAVPQLLGRCRDFHLRKVYWTFWQGDGAERIGKEPKSLMIIPFKRNGARLKSRCAWASWLFAPSNPPAAAFHKIKRKIT